MVSREEVERIAKLARLQLTEEEVDRIRVELDQMLDFVRKIDELDLPERFKDEISGEASLQLRDDVVTDSEAGDLVDLAPSRQDRLYEVPGVIEEVK